MSRGEKYKDINQNRHNFEDAAKVTIGIGQGVEKINKNKEYQPAHT